MLDLHTINQYFEVLTLVILNRPTAEVDYQKKKIARPKYLVLISR
jgi:hypothetical protein